MSNGSEVVERAGGPSTDSGALARLSATIRREHEAAAKAGATLITHAIAAGYALIEAKVLIPPGEWIACRDDDGPSAT